MLTPDAGQQEVPEHQPKDRRPDRHADTTSPLIGTQYAALVDGKRVGVQGFIGTGRRSIDRAMAVRDASPESLDRVSPGPVMIAWRLAK